MPRTKHALIVTVILCGTLAFVALLVFLLAPDSLSNGGHSTPAFLEEDLPGGALVYEEDLILPRRASLLERLRHYVGISAPATEETIPYEEVISSAEAEEPEGGVLVGSGKVSASPKVGHIYACQRFSGGNTALYPWIRDAYWFPAEKPFVDGEVSSLGSVSVTTDAGLRIVTSNGLPSHSTGIFPVGASNASYIYGQNSSALVPREWRLEVSEEPVLAAVPSCLPLGAVGLMLSGAALFSGIDQSGSDALAHEILDQCEGHPSELGIYHYHDESECVVSSVYEGGDSTLLGYALDGFGIYASSEAGAKLTNDDLDACHGHVHVIPWNGVLTEMYHYHMTDEFPYSLGCFMGTPATLQ